MPQKKGISYGSSVSKRKRDDPDHLCGSPHLKADSSICPGLTDEDSLKPVAQKRPKVDETNLTTSASTEILPLKDSSMEVSDFSASVPGLHNQFVLSLRASLVSQMT